MEVEGGKFEKLRQKRFPWCSLFLVVATFMCHMCVLVGNYKTAQALNHIGASTGGWSRVGSAVAHSLELELDARIHNVTARLQDSLLQITFVQEALDVVLSLVGMEVENIFPSTEREAESNATNTEVSGRVNALSLNRQQLQLVHHAAAQHVSLLQEVQQRNMSDAIRILEPVIMDGVKKVLGVMMDKVSTLLTELMEKLKPALEQVGVWLIKFGDRVQHGMEIFSVTLDRVQKIIDLIMSQLAGPGENEEEMFNQTLGLFDVSNTGIVTAQDLQDVARLYSITALQGDLAVELVEKYDVSGDGDLDRDEMKLFVRDPSLHNIMSHMLRLYARRLAQAGTVMAAAKQRDEVAMALVNYVGLVCAKNATKVTWVADRMANASLPVAFTADFLVELCFNEDDPTRVTHADIGLVMVSRMYELHPEATLAAVEMLSNSTYWVAAGFNPYDQPHCIKRVAQWVTQSSTILNSTESEALNSMSGLTVIEVLSQANIVPVHQQLLETLPLAAERMARENMSVHLMERRRTCEKTHSARFASTTSKLLLDQLLGGVAASDGSGLPTAAEQTVSMGQPAKPETLEFAQWLANNATENAAALQELCFEYDAESSNILDSYAAQIQGVVSSMQAFLSMTLRYSTPEGIQRMEDQISAFTKIAMDDVAQLIERRLHSLLNASSSKIDNAIHFATHATGERLGRMIGHAMANPLGQALTGPMQGIVKNMVHNPSFGDAMGEKLGKDIGQAVSNFTADALAKSTGNILDDLIDVALTKGSEAGAETLDDLLDNVFGKSRSNKRHQASLLQEETITEFDDEKLLAQLRAGRFDTVEEDFPIEGFDNLPNVVSGAWDAIVMLMRALAHMLPAAIKLLKGCRLQVGKLRGDMGNVFMALEHKGPPVFHAAADFWRRAWTAYFLCLLPLSGFLVYYGMWAGGYFGGPTPISDEEAEEMPAPATARDKLRVCCSSCSLWMKKYHDGHLCFWSTVLSLEVVALIVFAASIVHCILGGMKTFIVHGCADIYVLFDYGICTETLHIVRDFLDTFLRDDSMSPLYDIDLDEACDGYSLLTCDMITEKMRSSMLLTTVFGFLATLLTMQLVVDSAVRHEQATFRRLANKALQDEEQREPAATS